MTIQTWSVLIESLWTGEKPNRMLPGVCLLEVLTYVQHDYDEVDRMLIDMETMGA